MGNSHNVLDGTANDFERPWRRLDIILKYILKYFMKLLITNYPVVCFCDHYCLVRGEDFLNQLNTYNPFKASLRSYDPRKRPPKFVMGVSAAVNYSNIFLLCFKLLLILTLSVSSCTTCRILTVFRQRPSRPQSRT